ncbi:MAG TPA: ABC transporter substrate-binding protein [Candidatus Dormibacteraeota bacterium]|nr:ABC transporter substrate-binding protein [Candidatus Dormibacteraeota bacterium]
MLLGTSIAARARLGAAGPVAAAVLALAGCGSVAAGGTGASQLTLRLGYLPNLTQAPAIVGVQNGILQGALGPGTHLASQTFGAGPAAVEALFGGALDAAYVGPNPAINGFIRSKGAALRIVSGATSGGAALVVRTGEGIRTAADLRGRRIATPQLGNTQDVALRSWLRDHGLRTDPQGGGDVRIVASDNPTTLQLFEQGQLDGAWVPEPWASRLVDEGHATVLVDEATLWPGGRFPTTELVVATTFLDRHPDAVRRLVAGNVAAVDWLNAHGDEARAAANDGLRRLTQSALSAPVLSDAWSHLTFTADPLAASLQREADDAAAVGLLATTDLHGILDDAPLDSVLAGLGRAPVPAAGLGG